MPIDGTIKYAKDKGELIFFNSKSKKGRNIPLLMNDYKSRFPRLYIKTYLKMLMSIIQVLNSYKRLKYNPEEYKTKATNEDIDKLITYMKSLGVDKISFTLVPNELIFKHHSILHNNAIVFTYEMNNEILNTAPSKKCGHEVFNSYYDVSIISKKIASYLRENGYSAQVNSPIAGDVNLSVLAEKAGLGAIGLSGLLISPNIGPRQRIGAIFTSINNLPNIKDNEYLWIRKFCDMCNKCVRKCPSGALQNPPIKDKYKKCAKAYTDLYGCSICVKECVFNNNNYDLIKSRFERKLRKLRS